MINISKEFKTMYDDHESFRITIFLKLSCVSNLTFHALNFYVYSYLRKNEVEVAAISTKTSFKLA